MSEIRIVVELQDADGQVYALGHSYARPMEDTPIADHAVGACEHTNALTGRGGWSSQGMIGRYDSRQTVWALVARVAEWARLRADEQG